jgi:hypothetical protein
MVNKDKGNLGSKVFFVWGSLCCGCFLWAYFLVYETKGMFLHLLRLRVSVAFISIVKLTMLS